VSTTKTRRVLVSIAIEEVECSQFRDEYRRSLSCLFQSFHNLANIHQGLSFSSTPLITSMSIDMSRKRRHEDVTDEPASKRHAHHPSNDSSASTASHEDALDTRTCLVCDETKPVTSFPRIPHISSHGHGNDICYECYALHLEAEVDNKIWNQVSCPQCPMPLQEDEINVLSTPLTWHNYRRLVDRATLFENPRCRHCFSTSCDSGQVHDGALVFSCQTCSHKHCTTCDTNWHDDETCEEYQARHQTQKQQETDSEETVKAISKPCPRCDSPIEKNDGCDHMTCKFALIHCFEDLS
jgi:hypothetical protein